MLTCKIIECGRPINARGLCKKHYGRARRQSRTAADVIRKKQYYLNNKAHISERFKKYSSTPRYQELYRERHLRKTYGVTLSKCNEMLRNQNYSCKVCSSAKPVGNF